MYDLIIRRLNDDGTPTPGWRRSRPADVERLGSQLTEVGIAALDRLPATSPQRAAVLAWTKRAAEDGILPAGIYPLGTGKAALVIENANSTTLADAQARSTIAASTTRVNRPPATGRPKTNAEALRIIEGYRRNAVLR